MSSFYSIVLWVPLYISGGCGGTCWKESPGEPSSSGIQQQIFLNAQKDLILKVHANK